MASVVSPCFFGVPEKDGIYQVSFEVTNRCNLHCVHCMNRSDNSLDTDDGLCWSDMSKLIDEMKDNNVKEIYISGGEPTLYPHFKLLVEKTKSYGMDTLVATNAYDLNDSIDTIKKYVDIVFVSIDGTEDSHDFFRGVKGAYSKTLGNIKTLISMSIPVRISTVVSKNNINELEAIICDVRELGVFQIHFTVLVNVGRAATGEMLIDKEEYLYSTKVISDLQLKYSHQGFIITSRRNAKLDSFSSPCFGGRRMVHISSSGLVSPCSYIAKSCLSDKFSLQWVPGEFKACLDKCREFQHLCDERDRYFGHSSCAALAAIVNKSAAKYELDPLDIYYGET